MVVRVSTKADWCNIIWNNKEIRVNNALVFYSPYVESGIVFVKDLLIHLNNTDSFKIIEDNVKKNKLLGLDGTATLCAMFVKLKKIQSIL